MASNSSWAGSARTVRQALAGGSCSEAESRPEQHKEQTQPQALSTSMGVQMDQGKAGMGTQLGGAHDWAGLWGAGYQPCCGQWVTGPGRS